jgi:hypothetical protein
MAGFGTRVAIALAIAFLAFPFLWVLWHGNTEPDGVLACALFMFFLQFISPYGLWTIPLVLGLVAACLWHGIASFAKDGCADAT